MELKVMVAENGFVVSETEGQHMMGEIWAFETPDSLAKHMKEWGERNTKTEKPKTEKKI